MTFIDVGEEDFKRIFNAEVIKIDKGEHKELIIPLETMTVGDSFLLPHFNDAAKAHKLIAKLRGRTGYGFWQFKFRSVRVFPKGQPHKARITYRIYRVK